MVRVTSKLRIDSPLSALSKSREIKESGNNESAQFSSSPVSSRPAFVWREKRLGSLIPFPCKQFATVYRQPYPIEMVREARLVSSTASPLNSGFEGRVPKHHLLLDRDRVKRYGVVNHPRE